MSNGHSRFSASRFEQRMLCPGSEVLEQGKTDRSSKYADEGTAAHELAAMCQNEGNPASAYIGRVIAVGEREFTVDDVMAGHVQTYLDALAEYAVDALARMTERKVNYSKYLHCDTDDGWGTADSIIVKPNLLIVGDLKYGQGNEVQAEDNVQMRLYALGAMAEFEGIVDFYPEDRVLMVIHQPRISTKPKEWEISVAELLKFAGEAHITVIKINNATADYPSGTFHETFTRAGEKQCRYCKAKPTCPTAREYVSMAVADSLPPTPDDFADLTVLPANGTSLPLEFAVYDYSPEQWLAACLGKVDMIEDWCKAIRAEAEQRMLAGAELPGYKLVQGKRGNRAWTDAEAAEALLKTFRLKQEEMYTFNLISPTTAEKLAKAETIGKRQWPKLKELIGQSDGKLHVAPESDKREAIKVTPTAEDFDDMTATTPVSDDADYA